MPRIVESAGHKLIVGRANLGGCTLERHWRHVAAHQANPADKEGSPYRSGQYSLADMLTKDKWDFVTIQQVSIKSHDLDTCYPFAADLRAYIKERAPKAKIMARQIWACRVDDKRFVPENKGKEPHTRAVMHRQVRKAYQSVAKDLGIEIIPSGDAMFLADTDSKWGCPPDTSFDFKNAKAPELPNQLRSLHKGWRWIKRKEGGQQLSMDGHHANQAGEYLLGCVWFEVFFGESVAENAFIPDGLDARHAKFLRQTAHRAVAESVPKR